MNVAFDPAADGSRSPAAVKGQYECTLDELKALMTLHGQEGFHKIRDDYKPLGVLEICRRLQTSPINGTVYWSFQCEWPRAGFGVVRIDPLCCPAGCRKRRLTLALAILSLSLGFLSVSDICCAVNYRATFCIALFVLFMCSVSWLFLLVCIIPLQVIDWKDSFPK